MAASATFVPPYRAAVVKKDLGTNRDGKVVKVTSAFMLELCSFISIWHKTAWISRSISRDTATDQVMNSSASSTMGDRFGNQLLDSLETHLQKL